MNLISVLLILTTGLILVGLFSETLFLQAQCGNVLTSATCLSGLSPCYFQIRKYNRTTTVLSAGMNFTNVKFSQSYAVVSAYGRSGLGYSKVPFDSINISICDGVRDDFIVNSIMKCLNYDTSKCMTDGKDYAFAMHNCLIDLSKFDLVTVFRNDVQIRVKMFNSESKLLSEFIATGMEEKRIRRKPK